MTCSTPSHWSGRAGQINDEERASTSACISERISASARTAATATQLGIRSISRRRLLAAQLWSRHEAGRWDDFTIVRADGSSFAIDLAAAVTIGDVLDLINNNAANLNPLSQVTARLATTGNGIELVDSSVGIGQLQVQKIFGSNAAIDLGLVPQGQMTATGTGGVLTGAEINPQEVEGVFNSLFRLAAALEANDEQDIERAMELLDEDFDRINFSRAEIGFRGRNLEALQIRIDDETNQVNGSLSQEVDTDYASAIASLASRQAAIEASLRLAAQISQLTLLNFL
jgi:flagellin-like hook-associated protein FlgL